MAPNRLDRDFTATGPNQKWVADITFVPTSTGWAYLAAVMDLFSRRIVGWAVSESLESSLVLDALDQAIQTRRPGQGCCITQIAAASMQAVAIEQLLPGRGSNAV